MQNLNCVDFPQFFFLFFYSSVQKEKNRISFVPQLVLWQLPEGQLYLHVYILAVYTCCFLLKTYFNKHDKIK